MNRPKKNGNTFVKTPVRAGLVQESGDWPYRIGFEFT
jgi:hypothetical protein